MRFVKLLIGDIYVSSRDMREIDVVAPLFDENIILSKSDETRFSYREGIEGRALPLVRDLSVRLLNHAVSFLRSVRALRELDADVVSCHDIPALTIGYVANLFKRKKAALVYDAHEFEPGRNTGSARSSRMDSLVSRLESFLMKRVAFSIVVNDSIADELQRMYDLRERPVVVRSTPYHWHRDEAAVAERRQELMSTVRFLACRCREAFNLFKIIGKLITERLNDLPLNHLRTC